MFTARVQEEKDVIPTLKKLLVVSRPQRGCDVLRDQVGSAGDLVISGSEYTNLGIYWCYFAGAVAGLAVGLLTEYYTSHDFAPVRKSPKPQKQVQLPT